MKLIIVFGPAAVGKMTVGFELQKLTGFRLFHNHMVSELLYNFYGYQDKQFGLLNSEFRRRLFEEFSKSDFPGIIFTYVWALDQQDDHNELKRYMDCLGVSIDSKSNRTPAARKEVEDQLCRIRRIYSLLGKQFSGQLRTVKAELMARNFI